VIGEFLLLAERFIDVGLIGHKIRGESVTIALSAGRIVRRVGGREGDALGTGTKCAGIIRAGKAGRGSGITDGVKFREDGGPVPMRIRVGTLQPADDIPIAAVEPE
jgi:hypothetical protein